MSSDWVQIWVDLSMWVAGGLVAFVAYLLMNLQRMAVRMAETDQRVRGCLHSLEKSIGNIEGDVSQIRTELKELAERTYFGLAEGRVETRSLRSRLEGRDDETAATYRRLP